MIKTDKSARVIVMRQIGVKSVVVFLTFLRDCGIEYSAGRTGCIRAKSNCDAFLMLDMAKKEERAKKKGRIGKTIILELFI